MNTELQTVAAQVEQAGAYHEVFGALSGEKTGILRSITVTYRRLARVLHPDKYPALSADHELATGAFKRLNEFRDEAEKATQNGGYGKPTQLAVIRTKKATHRVLRSIGQGDICVTYQTETKRDGLVLAGFLKVANSPSDEDLLKAEAKALRQLRGPNAKPDNQKFVTELLDSFVYFEAGKPRRQANAITRLDGFYNLDQLRNAFGGRLDHMHMAWIWRRVLAAIGHAHENNVIHGAVLPRHIMILPEEHGVVLADWCYSVTRDDDKTAYTQIKAIVQDHREWYPEEVLGKKSPSPATDIVMAARTMIWLLGGDPVSGDIPVARAPRQFRAYFRGCLAKSQQARPDDAWLLLGEFDELLERMGPPYYPRRFRPLTLPSGMV